MAFVSLQCKCIFAQLKPSHLSTCFFFHCTMKTARKIVRRLQLRMHFNGQQNCRNSLMLTIIWANLSYPLTEIGFLCFSFFFSFQNELTVFKEIPWTGLKWQLSFHIVCTKNLETLLEGKFSMIKGALTQATLADINCKIQKRAEHSCVVFFKHIIPVSHNNIFSKKQTKPHKTYSIWKLKT